MVGLLFLLLCKMGLMVLSLTVLWLASRRLVLSRSANAWLYAATAIFALLTVLGLVPWIFAVGQSHPIFFFFAAITPAVWYSVATLCNSSRHVAYDTEIEHTFFRLAAKARAPKQRKPLILEGPDWPDAPVAVFRHTSYSPTPLAPDELSRFEPPVRDTQSDTFAPLPDSPPVLRDPVAVALEHDARERSAQRKQAASPTHQLLGIARTMRKNDSSEDRRIKLLPAPNSVDQPT